MVGQKEAVFSAVKSAFKNHHISFIEGQTDVASETKSNKDLRSEIVTSLYNSFVAGEIAFGSVFKSDADMKSYASSLLNNWIRKDVRLASGIKYVTKNPGSRAGSSDPELKELNKLLMVQTNAKADHSIISAIKLAITTKTEERKLAKTSKTTKVDMSKISPDLLAKIGLTV